jgi:cell division protein FtsI (penicillin-binding protein 3)
MQMDRKSELLLRVYVVFFAFVLFAGIIMFKVIKIALFEGDKWREQGGRYVKWVDVEGDRGNIYDVHGNLLATSLPYFDVYVDLVTIPNQFFKDNITSLSRNLEKHFGKTASSWKSELVKAKNAKNRYFPLFKKLSKEKRDLLKTFPIFKENKNKGGLISVEKSKREKPYKELCSRTIGLDRKNASKVGLERTYDKILQGDKERRLLRRFPGGYWLPVFDPTGNDQKRGGDVVSTLDMHIQDIAHHELLECLEKYEAEAGTVVVMEVETGAIKAMANLGRLKSGTYVEQYNYAVGRLSEPGSTFKLISSLAMMEDKGLSVDTRVALDLGKKKFFNITMHDSEKHGKYSATFQEAFEISSNVGMANAAYTRYGKSRSQWVEFYEALHKLGVMEQTGIEIAGERTPFFKNPSSTNVEKNKKWSGTTVPWMAHGYELEMTPLQILNVYNAVANDGRMMKPYLTNEIITSDGESKKISPRVIKERIAKMSVIKDAQKLLKGVAERGTARKLKVTNTSFAGKTGTTKLNYWKETDSKEYNASFAGYFPADNPKYSIIVVIYNPTGAYYGSKVAGPVFRDIVQRVSGLSQRNLPEFVEGRKVVKAHSGFKADYTKLLEFIGLDYDDYDNSKWVNMKSKSEAISIEKNVLEKKKVPNVKGMGLRDAVYVLETLGLEVEVLGVGQVYKQSIKPGGKIDKKSITIHLK